MASYKIGIVIPSFNEGDSIGWVIKELKEVLGSGPPIIVVNDCSTDNTAETAKKSGAYVLDLHINQGYSKAIEQGIDYAIDTLNVNFLITMDADGQHDPLSVKKILTLLESDEFDLVVGKRKRFARFTERIYGIYYRHKFGVDDPLCGLKGYRVSLILLILSVLSC